MRTALLAALLLLATCARAQEDTEKVVIQPHLAGLHLGDSLRKVRKRYPPTRDWPSKRDERRGVTRYRLEPSFAKSFPPHVQTLYFGVHWGKVVEIEAVYDEEYTRREAYEKLTIGYETMYGAPRRSGDRFWWSDGRTVLRVFPAELPADADGVALSSATPVDDPKNPPKSVVWRTGVQIFDQDVFEGD
jgi:hypothetical protein